MADGYGELKAADVYDLYGLSMLSRNQLDEDGRRMRTFFLHQVKKAYVDSLKARIVAEAGYINIDLKEGSIASMVSSMGEKMNAAIEKQAGGAAAGLGFNVLDMVQQAHQRPQQRHDRSAEMTHAADDFRSDKGKSRSAFGGEPWAKISEAFVAVERANTDDAIIQSIDHLNSLQHNTNHVLFDLAGGGIQAVLDEKFKAKKPREFASKLSGDVRKFLKQWGAL